METNNQIDLGLENAKDQIEDVSKELLVLRLAWGKLKVAVREAAAPVAAVLVPVLQKAVFWAIRLVKTVGQFMGALLGVDAVWDGMEKTVTKTAKAIRRSVASFDQLERLEGGSGSYLTTESLLPESGSLSPKLQAVVDQILAMLEPLRNIDFFALRWALARLEERFQAFSQQVGEAVQWVWNTILAPFMVWICQQLLPIGVQALTAGIRLLSAALTPLGEGFSRIWEAMQQVVKFVGDTVLTVFDQLRRLFVHVAETIGEKSQQLSGIFSNIAQAVTALWQVIGPVLRTLRTEWTLAFEDFGKNISAVLGRVIDALYGVTEFLAGAFTGDWDRAWKGLGQGVKGCVNSVIGFLNAMLSAVASGINGIILAVNKLKISVPDWVPGLGGKTLGFNLKTVTAPQIPYLAQGAVLPANRPFLAVVGDQRNGTNVEAPLATIQEAVALVMGEQLGAVMAGFDATVRELRSLRDTVSGIEVGDTVIGSAARRYEQKMAVLTGQKYM